MLTEADMAASFIPLEHCEAAFSASPEPLLVLQGPSLKLKLSGWSINTLMKVLPTVVAKVNQVQEEGQENLPDQILHSFDLFKSNSNCIKLESSIYQGKPYIFAKSFFQDKNKSQKVAQEQDGELVRDELYEQFEQLVQSNGRDKNSQGRWIPRTAPIRLTLNDISELRKFIVAQYSQM